MEFFKSQINRIQEQLGGLSATQKMLTASLVTIMVMTLYWWSHYAAEPEMESIVSAPLTTEDVGQITNHLDGKGIHYRVSGGQVLVAADRKMEVLADLTYSQSLPRNVKMPFDDMIAKISPLNDPQVTEAMMREAKQRTLAMVISNFPGVANAVVVIDPRTELRMDNTSVQASAMVTITTRHDGKASLKQLASAAADVVSGAESGLVRTRVNVLIDGVSFPVQGKDDAYMAGGDGSFVDAMRQQEQYYCDKIRREYQEIPGFMVSVTVKLNTAFTDTVSTHVDPKNVVSVPTRTEERTEDTPIAGASPEPGTVPNTSVSVAGPAAQPASATVNESKTEFMNEVSRETKSTKQGPGDAVAVAASVRVPRSYLVEAFKANNGGREPDTSALDIFTAEQIETIRKNVKANTGIASEDDVVVNSYPDPKPVEPAIATVAAAAPVTSIVSLHGKEIGVGLLAGISLFMMSMMVRKSTPLALVMPPVEREEPTSLGVGGDVAGEAGESNTMLDGMELDEDTVKTQTMLDQVQQMVTENPDAAANLVKRWLNRT